MSGTFLIVVVSCMLIADIISTVTVLCIQLLQRNLDLKLVLVSSN